METQSSEIGKLALALSKAQAKLNGASKSSSNPFFKSKYADLHECIEASKEALSENELAVIQTTTDGSNGGVTIVTTLCHSSGEWIRGSLTMAPKKDDDQSRGGSITYGRRYCYAAIVGLAQKDDDGNAATEPTDKKTNAKQPKVEAKPENKDGMSDEEIMVIGAEEYLDSLLSLSSVEFLKKWTEWGKENTNNFTAASKKRIANFATQIGSAIKEREIKENK